MATAAWRRTSGGTAHSRDSESSAAWVSVRCEVQEKRGKKRGERERTSLYLQDGGVRSVQTMKLSSCANLLCPLHLLNSFAESLSVLICRVQLVE